MGQAHHLKVEGCFVVLFDSEVLREVGVAVAVEVGIGEFASSLAKFEEAQLLSCPLADLVEVEVEICHEVEVGDLRPVVHRLMSLAVHELSQHGVVLHLVDGLGEVVAHTNQLQKAPLRGVSDLRQSSRQVRVDLAGAALGFSEGSDVADGWVVKLGEVCH